MTAAKTAAPTSLTGTEKVAVVMMNLGQDRAAEVMKEFSELEAASIIAEIVGLRRVDDSVAEEILA